MKEFNDELLPSEAIYEFAGWLTTREERTVMSSSDDAAPIAELVAEFCKKKNLEEPRGSWGKSGRNDEAVDAGRGIK